ncbi:hypothetical protein SPICUR_04825 [Spiribacter curvatus]|uniref:AB hydrolase-1 domain-containing protein n=1 Tax=Spiribacter curvatus TaxID=1335757 RepID=U5T6U6_9GAMM|nr:hypothetical protein SPICUR_04825 [Spiribacter curvatus]
MFAHFHWPNWVQSSDPALEILTSQPPAARAARRTPIVFVHGAFMGAWSWQPNFLDYFASQGFHAIAPSLRGHGGSEGIERLDSASINDYVNDLATVVGELNGPPPILVGHSMGALVVQRYMERATVSAAVLMAPVPPHGLMPSTLRMMTTDPMLYWQFGMMQFFGAGTVDSSVAQRAVFSETTPREDLESYAELVQRESQRALWDMNVHARGRPRLVSGDVPMHVIAGAEDALFNARETKAVANVWDATWEALPGLAHAMMIEPGWERSADAIIEWLDSRNID